MKRTIEKLLKSYAKYMTILIVDDDELSVEIYAEILSNYFFNVETASNGLEALEKLKEDEYDIVLTDILMPKMDGFQLIEKIRLKSPDQHIVILTALNDLNEMRYIINLGIDGIVLKPFNQEVVFKIFIRVLKNIKNIKVKAELKARLKLSKQENEELQSSLNNHTKTLVPKTPKVESELSKKYNIRETIHGKTANDISSDVDSIIIDDIYTLHERIGKYETIIISIENSSPKVALEALGETLKGLHLLIDIMEELNDFEVSVQATKHLIEFLESINEETLSDDSKKQLFVDAYVALYEDINLWIEKLFLNQDSANINYFDASFANTCLEIEAIFSIQKNEDDDSDLEFF